MSAASSGETASPGRRGVGALAVIIFARVSVSFQFQSVAPLSILLDERFPVGLSGLGLLLGLYMAPGIVIALVLPGLLARFGRAATICTALLLMAAGELLLWTAGSFGTAVVARLIAGTGGCVIYIVTINMVADLDTTVPRPTRMGLIAAAWPLGNALALGGLGWLVHAGGSLAARGPLVLILISLAAIGGLLLRQRGEAIPVGPSPSRARWRGVLGRIWPIALAFAFYNIGFIILTGFAARILTDDGLAPSVSSAIASLPMWMFLISVPLGGFIAGRSVGGDLRIVLLACIVAAIAVLASTTGVLQAPLYVLAGLVGGLPTAPLLDRGREVSDDGTDITYSALFFVFFAALIVLPPLAGWLADFAGTSHVILWIVAALLGIAALLFQFAMRSRASPTR